MSNQNNSTNVTDDDIKKSKEYTDAMDKLKTAISGVNSKLPEFSDGLQAGLKALGEKLPDVVEAITKLNAQNKELAASGQKPVSILSQLASSMFSWNSLISIGITLLTTYSGAIINWVSDLIKGETRLSALGKAMKDSAIVANALIETRLRGAQSAQGELTALNSLYRATQEHGKALAFKKGVIDQLKDQWPAAFKNFKDEEIAAGKASDAYKNLKEQIMAAAYAEAYKNKIASNTSRVLENDLKIANEREKNLKILVAQKTAQDNLDSYNPSNKNSGYENFLKSQALTRKEDIGAQNAVDDQTKLREASDKILYDLNTDSKLLTEQNNKMGDSIEALFNKYGSSALTGKETFKEQEKQQSKLKTQTEDYLSEAEKLRKDSLARQLQTIFEGYGAEAQAENKRYDQELGGLKTLFSKKKISQEEFNKVSKQLTAEHNGNLSKLIDKYNREDAAKVEQAQNELIDLQNKGMQEGAEKQKKILVQQQEENLQQIKKSDDEIIAQQQNLQIQMALAIGTGDTKDAGLLAQNISAKEKLLATNAAKRIEIENQTQNELDKIDKETTQKEKLKKDQENIDDDQSKVDNANSPSAKLAAQKKLIWDQAQYEIDAANGNSVKILQIETKRNKAIADLDKQSRKQRQDQEIQIAQQVASAAFSLISNSIKSSSEAKIKGLESDKAKELSNTNLTKSQKAAIEAKYKKKENDEKVKAFKAEQKMQIAQAVINGAIAVTKTLSTMALPAAIPFIAADVAMTAMQIATIASQKPPKFARGGQFISDGRGALLPGYSRTDNTNAYLRSGEAVVVSEAMRNPWARNLVSAINVAHGGRDFSAPNPGNGYAIGGIFTDGGNANRYYNQPVNDVKELANTVAYQMINNFPPIYVDVKDVNNQQNILAQTVDRVNL